MDFDSILSVEGNTAAITSADGFGNVCFGGDDNIFSGECGGGGVEGGVDTFFGEGDVEDGGTIENTLWISWGGTFLLGSSLTICSSRSWIFGLFGLGSRDDSLTATATEVGGGCVDIL